MNPILLIGPFVAVIGVVSVFFVLRHKSVQTRSMYSSRRSNLERKVRAARTRTLGPEKHVEKEPAAHAGHGAPGGPTKLTYEPSAFQGPPVAPPPAPMAAPNQTWDVGPTAPAPSAQTAAPPPAPAYAPPPQAPPPEPVWTPSPPEPAAAPAKPSPSAPAAVPAGAGASWSIVGGESKDVSISDDGKDGKKKKKGKRDAETSAWQLASGEAPGDESEDEAKRPSAVMAVAQYAVVAVGLLAVLIGIMLMIATSKGT